MYTFAVRRVNKLSRKRGYGLS